MKNDVSEDFRRMVKRLFYSSVEYDCYELQRAIKGLGTDEEVSVEILTIRSNKRLQAIQNLYPKCKDLFIFDRMRFLFFSKCSSKR